MKIDPNISHKTLREEFEKRKENIKKVIEAKIKIANIGQVKHQLPSFESKGLSFTNPFMDEEGTESVDPIKYYGDVLTKEYLINIIQLTKSPGITIDKMEKLLSNEEIIVGPFKNKIRVNDKYFEVLLFDGKDSYEVLDGYRILEDALYLAIKICDFD